MEPGRDGVAIGADGRPRCWWCVGDPLYERYHDLEWGRPVADDTRIFEKLCLEGFQSGLSWITILRKRDNFRKAFRSFDIHAVSRFTSRSIDRLLLDPGIVRHRGKIAATINNAKRCIDLVEEAGSLAAHVWLFEPAAESRAFQLDWDTLVDSGVPPEARALSKDLRRRGWSFVGPTTVFSMMQSIGLVDDHMEMCSVRPEVEAARSAFPRPRVTLPRSPAM
ncbi:MAG: DNA-3-methyladenine glycosylase I [Actinobacteria bacterium]|nr:MAG: DNA-3-methyladenine glycosylase I [Actinomycetota bacterium]